MSIVFDCPFCNYSKEVPDSYKGKKIKCPRCLATLTLGLRQYTELADPMPLPEDDESPLDTMAIEVDEGDSLIECPVCLALINTKETRCPVYRKYQEQEESGKKAEKAALKSYEKIEKKVRNNLYAAALSILPVVGILFGLIALFWSARLSPLVCENIEIKNRQRINAIRVTAGIGILFSLVLLVYILFFVYRVLG